jgi:hypothetical protein
MTYFFYFYLQTSAVSLPRLGHESTGGAVRLPAAAGKDQLRLLIRDRATEWGRACGVAYGWLASCFFLWSQSARLALLTRAEIRGCSFRRHPKSAHQRERGAGGREELARAFWGGAFVGGDAQSTLEKGDPAGDLGGPSSSVRTGKCAAGGADPTEWVGFVGRQGLEQALPLTRPRPRVCPDAPAQQRLFLRALLAD